MFLSKKQKDILNGGLLGLIVPVVFSPLIAFIFYKLTSPDGLDFGGYLETIFKIPKQLSNIISLSSLLNIGTCLFFYFKKKDDLMRGVIMALLLYTVFVFVLKLSFE